jgi:hypothetical protein
MSSVEKTRKSIVSLFNDLENFKNPQTSRVDFAGSGYAKFIKNIDASSVTYSPAEIILPVNEGMMSMNWKEKPDWENKRIQGKNYLPKGTVNIVGDITVEAQYNEPTFVFSRDGLFDAVSRYSYKLEVRNEGSNRLTFKDEYWTRILDHYVKTGNWDAGPKNWMRNFNEQVIEIELGNTLNKRHGGNREFLSMFSHLRGRRMSEEVTGDIGNMKLSEAIESAKTTKEVYDSSANNKCVTVLKSIQPFVLAKPDKVKVSGEDMKLYFCGADYYEGTNFKGFGSGSMELYADRGIPSIPLPAVVNSINSEIPLTKADVRRSDGMTKANETLIKDSSDIYIEGSDTIKIGRHNLAKNIAKSAALYPVNVVLSAAVVTAAAELVLGLGYNGIAEVGSWIFKYPHSQWQAMWDIGVSGMNPTNPWGMANYAFSAGSNLYSKSRDILRTGKEVKGDGDMNLWLKGYEK